MNTCLKMDITTEVYFFVTSDLSFKSDVCMWDLEWVGAWATTVKLPFLFAMFCFFTAVFFLHLVSIKQLSIKLNLKVLPSRVSSTFFLAQSQTSCHGSTVGTDDVAQVHTSQPRSH